MKNNFPEAHYWTMLQDNYFECWGCGKNHANCGHHIFGRGHADSKVERSIMNFAPMNNNECHLPKHGYWRNDDGKKFLLEKTIAYLAKIGYNLNTLDNEFLAKYQDEIARLKLNI